MIKYSLRCTSCTDGAGEFEAWFSKGSDFDDQKKRGLVICPVCGSKNIEKAPMAPAVMRKSSGMSSELEKAAQSIRKDLEESHTDVGENFSDEARAMHYGEKPERGIYGTASGEEAKALREEGVAVMPLPDIFVPKPKKKLN